MPSPVHPHGVGSGTILYTVAPNPSTTTSRSGTLVISGLRFTVTDPVPRLPAVDQPQCADGRRGRCHRLHGIRVRPERLQRPGDPERGRLARGTERQPEHRLDPDRPRWLRHCHPDAGHDHGDHAGQLRGHSHGQRWRPGAQRRRGLERQPAAVAGERDDHGQRGDSASPASRTARARRRVRSRSGSGASARATRPTSRAGRSRASSSTRTASPEPQTTKGWPARSRAPSTSRAPR